MEDPTTSVEVRDELETLLERDLLGPWDGPEEELPPGVPPSERYLLGRLVPRTPPPAQRDGDEDADIVDRETLSSDESSDTEVEPEATVRTGSRAASSVGLSFQVPGSVDAVVVAATWGRYEQTASEQHETPTGRPSRVWKRVSAGGAVEVRLDAEGDDTSVPDPAHENVLLRVKVRHRAERRIVDLALVNDQPAPTGSPDTARLYQVSITVTALDGAAAVFLGHNDPELATPADDRDDERRSLAMLYRGVREYAHGRQCAVDTDVRDGDTRAWRLTTTSFPRAEVPLVVPGDPTRMPGLVLDMARLGSPELARDDVADRLTSQKVRTRRRRPNVSELTSRMPSDRIASTLAELERPFSTDVDTSAALQRFREDRAAREAAIDRPRPIDVLLATSMLQVGVDVPRLGLMVVTGQPKNTAEYIQATSRVGRTRGKPGLILTIFQWSRPRDLGHYERFGYNHATFGLRVEGVTTTPFSDRALDRGLSAVLVAAVRHRATASLPNTAAHDVSLSGPAAAELLSLLFERASRVTHDVGRAEQVRKQVQHRLDRWGHRRNALPSGRLGYQEAADVAGLLAAPGEGSWSLWTAPRSMREVENEVLLQLHASDLSTAEEPEWSYAAEETAP